MVSFIMKWIVAMVLGLSSPSAALQTSKGEEELGCNDWCTKDQCNWKVCSDCDMCDTEEPPPTSSVADCEGNCAEGKAYTCAPDVLYCEDKKMTEYSYDPTATPMKYEYGLKCEDFKYWVEVDLGAVTSFNKVEFVRPYRTGPPGENKDGWCGTKIEVDGTAIYTNSDFVLSGPVKLGGKNQDVVVVKNDGGSWEGQKIKVYSGVSYKNKKGKIRINYTAHFAGVQVYNEI